MVVLHKLLVRVVQRAKDFHTETSIKSWLMDDWSKTVLLRPITC